MTSNEQAISNLRVLSHNVMSYRSFYNSKRDIYGEVDDAAQNAENALLHLVEVMERLDDKNTEITI